MTLTILVLSTFDGRNANVIRDFLFSFNAYSRHRYHYVFDCATLDADDDLSGFDVILLFWSLYLLGPDLAPRMRERIRAARAIKVLFLQDEYRDVRPMNAAMRELGIQAMFTCVAEPDHEVFYPRALVPTLETIHTVLPGYVPADLEHLPPRPETRPLDVAYRSRDVPFYLGDLGREKRIIADRFREICAAHGLRADISVREADRLYGDRWVGFLGRSRCVLGTASGASVVDFTGTIRRRSEVYLGLHPEATYAEVKARFFADVDGRVVIETASPRVFEAAALRTTMVHHEGRYSSLLEPDRHFIEVKRDYSNVADVVDRIRDHGFCRELATNAHRDLVAGGRHSYRAFARGFDARLDRLAPRPTARRRPSRAAFYARRYSWRRRVILPRHDRFVVVPSLAGPLDLVRRALASRPALRRAPVVARFVADPARSWRIAAGAARAILASPCLRAVCAAYLRARSTRLGVPAWRLVEDLLKLDIVRRARGGVLSARDPFVIDVAFEPETALLTLTSAAPRDDAGAVAPDVARAVLDGAVELVMWDHTSVGEGVVYEARPGGWLHVGLGSSGVHRFDALALVYRRARPAVAPALLAILRGEDGASR